MLCIDFGSGYNPKDGYKTCDFTMLPYLDYVCNDNKIYDREAEVKQFSVDKIHCRNVLHHIKDLHELLRNFYNYLKPDGELEIIECTEDSYYANYCLDSLWYRYVIPRKEVWFADKYRDYLNIAKEIGFSIKSSIRKNEKEIFVLGKQK